jgi:hypothetical protein
VAGSCEHGNEHSGHIRAVEYLDQSSEYQFLKKDSVPRDWSIS